MATLIPSSQPWVEKFRPKQLKDVAHQDEVVRVLTNTIETGSCPHMLFHESPSISISHQLFGIIEPLASRCAKFIFKPLSEEIMTNRIMHICNEAGLALDSEVHHQRIDTVTLGSSLKDNLDSSSCLSTQLSQVITQFVMKMISSM